MTISSSSNDDIDCDMVRLLKVVLLASKVVDNDMQVNVEVRGKKIYEILSQTHANGPKTIGSCLFVLLKKQRKDPLSLVYVPATEIDAVLQPTEWAPSDEDVSHGLDHGHGLSCVHIVL